MSEIRSAAAQAGYLDTELLLFNAAAAFHAAKTPEALDAAWTDHVRPAYGQLSELTLSLLQQLHALNMVVIRMGRA